MELLISAAHLAEQCFHVATPPNTLVKAKADSGNGTHGGGFGQLGPRKPDTFDSTAVTSARSSLDASLISVKKTLAWLRSRLTSTPVRFTS